MQRGNRRQPGAGFVYWAHEARRLHGRDQVDEFEGDVFNANREAPVEFWKETEEAVQENLGRSGENRLAGEGELEARSRSLSQPEADRSAQAQKCRGEDEADEARCGRTDQG